MGLGYEVTYVRNFTDVDDKIIALANEGREDENEPLVDNSWYLNFSDRFCKEYLIDMGNLQCLLPTHQPRVSEQMEQIIDMIRQIIKKGYGYVVERDAVDGDVVKKDVYFAVDNYPNYGKLSGEKLQHTRSRGRVPVDIGDDIGKRKPADFALWKSAKLYEPGWDSPWGRGRPGWHIACSAMSVHYLTFKFDIHGGGIELIFPHHENEIAQSGAACECEGSSTVSYWLHNNSVSMSRSLGNIFIIREVTELYHPLSLRYYLLSVHYRSPFNYDVSQLDIASDALYYFYQSLQDCKDALSPFQEGAQKDGTEDNHATAKISQKHQECISTLKKDFVEKMSDDLNTGHILTGGAFKVALRTINTITKSNGSLENKEKRSSTIQSVVEIVKEVKKVLEILGLLSSLEYFEVLQQFKLYALKRAGMEEDDVLRSIEDRMLARNNKEYAKSDQIREDMERKGIKLIDVSEEMIWRPSVPSGSRASTSQG